MMRLSKTARFISSTAAVFVLSTLYLLFIALSVRHRLWLEIAISLLFPVIIFATGQARYFTRGTLLPGMDRVRQLFLFESFYNAVVIFCLFSILLGFPAGNNIASWGFVLFFCVQAGGFLVAQIKRKKPHGIFQSSVLLTLILWWWWTNPDTTSIIDQSGRFLMWGEDAPLSVKLVYTIWAINGLLVDTTVLPKLRQAAVHVASLLVCWWSGEFFHVRLLTACHLFLLDGILGYSQIDLFGAYFCSLPEGFLETFKDRVQPLMALSASVAILIIFLVSLYIGLQLVF